MCVLGYSSGHAAKNIFHNIRKTYFFDSSMSLTCMSGSPNFLVMKGTLPTIGKTGGPPGKSGPGRF